MRTRTINFKQKQSVFWDYFLRNTTDTRCMRNTANFYIRNTMTGLKKDPADRTEHEKEVLRDVFHGIEMANIHAAERYHKKLASLARTGGMKSAVACSVLKQTVFTYPTKEKWFLNYGTLDAVFKETRHPVYTRMASQVNQNAIRKTVRAWEGYFKALREYNSHPEKYQAKPGIPGYIREQESTAWWTRQTAKLCIRNGKAFLQFVGMKEMFCIGSEDDFSGLAYVKTEISPYHGQFKVMVTFDDKAEAPAAPERPACILGIDTGLDNLLAVAGNFGCHPFIIKGGRPAAAKFMDALKLASNEVHVADIRTCVLHPASETHRQLTDEQLAAAGIDGGMVRFSVGLESVDDILDDLKQAFAAIQ